MAQVESSFPRSLPVLRRLGSDGRTCSSQIDYLDHSLATLGAKTYDLSQAAVTRDAFESRWHEHEDLNTQELNRLGDLIDAGFQENNGTLHQMQRRMDQGFNKVDQSIQNVIALSVKRLSEAKDQLRHEAEDRSDQIERQSAWFKEEVVDRLDTLEGAIHFRGIARDTDRFKALENRFETVNSDLSFLKESHKTVDSRFDVIDTRLDTVDTRFDAVDARFDAVGNRFDAIDNTLSSFKDDVGQRFQAVSEEFKAVDQRFDGIDHRLDSMDQALEQMQRESRNALRCREFEEIYPVGVRRKGQPGLVFPRHHPKTVKEFLNLRSPKNAMKLAELVKFYGISGWETWQNDDSDSRSSMSPPDSFESVIRSHSKIAWEVLGGRLGLNVKEISRLRRRRDALRKVRKDSHLKRHAENGKVDQVSRKRGGIHGRIEVGDSTERDQRSESTSDENSVVGSVSRVLETRHSGLSTTSRSLGASSKKGPEAWSPTEANTELLSSTD
ncbi:MAG: hypothetical protein M1817_005164 [Caeruleum heppii]|nr:MAG: hypothetical protein M1817_005164 [Caeruleum heppii]